MKAVRGRRIPLFWAAVLIIAVNLVILVYVIPYGSMAITGRPYPLSVPTALWVTYMAVVLLGIGLYVTISDEQTQEFLAPLVGLLEGGRGPLHGAVRGIALVGLPLVVGGLVYNQTAPGVRSPTGIRIQHPGLPGQFEKLVNPFRAPDPTDPAVQRFMTRTGVTRVEDVTEAVLEEGRALYQINCRPCHGSKADSNGPMAGGFRLRPADFTDPGTISTVVEPFVFWRVKEGGRGLPIEATPWDSAMPRWKDELTDDQIWMIILAEYDTAGVDPRIPEQLY